MAGPSFDETLFSKAKFLAVVLIVHIAMVGLLQFSSSKDKKIKIEKPLEVKTIVLNSGAKKSSSPLKKELPAVKTIPPQATTKKAEEASSKKEIAPTEESKKQPSTVKKEEKKESKKEPPKAEKKEVVKKDSPKKEVKKPAEAKPVVKNDSKTPSKKEAPVKKQESTSSPKTVSSPLPKAETVKKESATKKTEPAKNIAATTKSTSAKKEAKETSQEISLSNEELELLSSLQTSVSKLGSSSSSISKGTSAFKAPLDQLGIEKGDHLVSTADQERDYKSDLVYKLKRVLKLPEVGDVRVELTISRDGKILRLNLLKSDSEKNKSYVEKQLASLSLPPFEERFKGISQKTFTITLSNDL